MSKPVKFLGAALLVSVAVTLAIVVSSGRAVAASTASVTCPDNTTGIKYHGWTVVCSGQKGLGATVTVSPVTMDGLPVAVKVPNTDTFVSADSAFDTKKADTRIILTSQSTGSQAFVEVTVTAPKGAPPGGGSTAKPAPRSSGPSKFYRLVFRP